MKKRINPSTGREEVWVQPPGLPGIWSTLGYCDRCQPYNECMGFLDLSDEEWVELEALITESFELAMITSALKGKILKKCSN
jgi:hypothetical protein